MSHQDTVIIIGGGSTVADYNVGDLRQYGYVIGVNDAALYKKCNAALSMDRRWVENRHPLIKETPMDLFYRQDAVKNIREREGITTFQCDYKSANMTKEKGFLNGTNSGLCALNLAFQMPVHKVYLLGFDMCRHPETNNPYWYKPYPWAKPQGGTGNTRYNEWAQQFEIAHLQFIQKGVKIRNVTHRSKIKCFPKITYEQFLEELNNAV